VREFQLLGSHVYPVVAGWADLGTFTARYSSGAQTFDVPEPAWVRYLKFKFVSHYGSEVYLAMTWWTVRSGWCLNH
jgi:hypothetical protein